jgi:serine/threonine protein kinase
VRAVHYLHKQGLLHRDLKSANVCLGKDFTAKLIDCGLGKLVDDTDRGPESFVMSSGSQVFGSNGYICPWYSKGGNRKYEPACDVYSIGIVLFEVITGCLQLSQSTGQGQIFGDFRDRYLEDEDEDIIEDGDKRLTADADPLAGWEDETLLSFAELAIQCCKTKKKDRPTTDELIERLTQLVHAEELGSTQALQIVSSVGPPSASLCALCSRFPHSIKCENGHGVCGQCLDKQVERNLHAPTIVCPITGCFSHPYHSNQLEQTVSIKVYSAHKRQMEYQQNLLKLVKSIDGDVKSIRGDVSFIRRTVLRSLKALTHLTAGTTELCPRLVWLTFPSSGGSLGKDPRNWLKAVGTHKVHIYLFCQHSYTLLEPPIELVVLKEWVKRIAPVLKLSILLLRCAAIALIGVPPPLPTNVPVTNNEKFDLQDQFVAGLLDKAQLAPFRKLDTAVKENDQSILTDMPLEKELGQMKQLTGSAYKMLAEKLGKDKRSWWKEELKPVLDKDLDLIYVKKEFEELY